MEAAESAESAESLVSKAESLESKAESKEQCAKCLIYEESSSSSSSSKSKSSVSCQTYPVRILPIATLSTTAILQHSSNNNNNENINVEEPASTCKDSSVSLSLNGNAKRPYPGSSIPVHLTKSQIRNSPVRASHSRQVLASPALKKLKSVTALISGFEERVERIQRDSIPGSPREFSLSHFGSCIPRD